MKELDEHPTNERLLPISANTPVKMAPSKTCFEEMEEEKIESHGFDSEVAKPATAAAAEIEEEKVNRGDIFNVGPIAGFDLSHQID